MKNKMTLKLIVTIVVTVTLIALIMAPIYFYLQPKMYIEQQKRIIAEFSEKFKAVEPFDKEHLSEFVTNSRENYRIYVFEEDFTPVYASYEFGNNQRFIKKLYSIN